MKLFYEVYNQNLPVQKTIQYKMPQYYIYKVLDKIFMINSIGSQEL